MPEALMRPYKKGGQRIGFAREALTGPAESVALEIVDKLELLSSICDNRALSMFPVDTVKDVVGLCNDLKDLAPHYPMPTDYVDYVRENREAIGYFEKSAEGARNEETRVINKRKMFDIFKRMVEKMGEI